MTYFLIMSARLRSNNLDLSICYEFAKVFDPEVVGGIISSADINLFCDRLMRVATDPTGANHMKAIACLKHLCIRFSCGYHLSPFHVPFIKLCLAAKAYTTAINILDIELSEFSEVFQLSAQDVILYYYYGGLVYMGLKKFEQASEFFQMAINAPAQVTSAIQIEAYKRLLIIDLIAFGKPTPLPKYLSAAVGKALRSNIKGYDDFAKAYESGNLKHITDKFQQNEQTFARDGMTGLVKQSIVAFFSTKISHLTRTYITLSLTDIQSAIGNQSVDVVGEIESHLLKMIRNGQIDAVISHRDAGIVSFNDVGRDIDCGWTSEAVQTEIKRLMVLTDEMEALNREIGLSKEYLFKNSRNGANLGPGNADDDENDGDFSIDM
jgi:COP9 signalosome complex subunit 3